MLNTRLAVCTVVALASAAPLGAQKTDPSDVPAMSCDDRQITPELRQLCDGIDAVFRDAMAQPDQATGSVRTAPLPSLVRRPIRSEITAGGLFDPQDRTNPLAATPDRSVGVLVTGTDTPMQLSTQMVQPGDPEADTRLNWELKAERGATAVQSGPFMGGSASGTYDGAAGAENLSAFAGVRKTLEPSDSVRFGSKVAPRVNVTENATASMSFEPKLTTTAEFGRIGASDLRGSFNAAVGYQLPVGGDPSVYGGFRFSLTPR